MISVLSVNGGRNGAFTEENVTLLAALADHAAIAIRNAIMYEQLRQAYLSTVGALVAAVDAKDPYTRGHSESVQQFAVKIAQQMGLSPREVEVIQMAALLHDIGKIGIGEHILRKPGKFTAEEFSEMSRHPELGEKIIRPVQGLQELIPLVRHHHEHLDGNGYPDGVQGEKIPLGARILAVADAFDAMISHRPYRPALTIDTALAEIERCKGRQFDPAVADCLVALIKEGNWSVRRTGS